ncbi:MULTISPECIES: sugar phosphate nucleotidyltransferase [unclassified Rhodanobacter]|uniref:sugar phosphate nucleotidyltransferase n=1 Tax=unclassified Rhodanobacter TaxID=2621553 RepID=UPI001BE1102C|nr:MULTISPECIES: sugar phosphate nucleotidyltransferase [unclassified Rhodanobacter]MBT2145637.1 NTP transferase domain-containing protein [Rhodanobacter sp. LX-99]MBT2149682.1 NTP transferase domain-containing protein [Rhodanobacter sp. LX-100]
MPRAKEAIVLAGGLGTRLRSVVTDLPKPLASVAGRPFLAHLLDQLAAGGLRRVILATGYMAEKIEQTIGARWAGMDIAYSQEPEPLGTGGAIRLAAALLQGNGVHLANGDTFLRYDPAALERIVGITGATLGVALARVQDVGRYGAVDVADDRVIAFREKGGHGPGLVNAGSYFLTAEAVDGLPGDESAYSFESRVLLPRALAGDVAAMDDTRDFIDIGVPDDYARAQQLLGR